MPEICHRAAKVGGVTAGADLVARKYDAALTAEDQVNSRTFPATTTLLLAGQGHKA
jgi:hypothetical protein